MAVLNSATAAEIALSEMLDDKLVGLPDSVSAIVVNATQGLSRLSSTLSKRFDVELPAGINQSSDSLEIVLYILEKMFYLTQSPRHSKLRPQLSR